MQGAAIENPIKKTECAKCGGVRNCQIKGEHIESGSDEYLSWSTTWYILKCLGCDYVFSHTISTDSESYHHYQDDNGDWNQEAEETLKYWPAISSRKHPSWFDGNGIQGLKNVDALEASLIELYGALDAGLNMLTAIGIRTVFDIASESLNVPTELSFKEKLASLVEQGHIGMADEARLTALVDAGSASAHRGWKPNSEEIRTMMDTLEHFIENAFVFPAKKAALDASMQKMKSNVPPRVKRTKKISAST